MMEQKNEQPKRLTDSLNKIIGEICSGYCRYNIEEPKTEEESSKLWEKCRNCPFTRLL